MTSRLPFFMSSYFGLQQREWTTLSSAPFSFAYAGSNIAGTANLGGGNGPVFKSDQWVETFFLPGTPYGNWDPGDGSHRCAK